MNEVLEPLDRLGAEIGRPHRMAFLDAAAFIRAQHACIENAGVVLRAARLALKSARGLDHFGATAIRMITDFLEDP